MKMALMGIGTVTALGSGIDTLRAGMRGEVKPRAVMRTFATSHGTVELAHYLPVVQGLEDFIPPRAGRRLDELTRSAVLASALAIDDSGLDITERQQLGIVYGTADGPLQTTFNLLDRVIDDGDMGASPTLFSNSVHNTMASQTSILLKCDGPVTTLTAFGSTVATTLQIAELWLKQGTANLVLAGLGDECCEVSDYYAATLRGGGRIDKPVPSGSGFVSLLLGRSDFTRPKHGYLACEGAGIEASAVDKERLNNPQAVFLTQPGRDGNIAVINRLRNQKLLLTSHQLLWGEITTGAAFEIAAAAVSLQDGLYPSPVNDLEQALPAPLDHLTCLEDSGDCRFNAYHITRT